VERMGSTCAERGEALEGPLIAKQQTCAGYDDEGEQSPDADQVVQKGDGAIAAAAPTAMPTMLLISHGVLNAGSRPRKAAGEQAVPGHPMRIRD